MGDDLNIRIEQRDGYVFVWQGGLATSIHQLEEMQQQIEDAMIAAGSRFVVFDNRDTEAPEEWLRASMWSWLCEHVRRAALIQAEVRNIKRAERTGARNRLPVRAFDNEADAEAWLLAVEPSPSNEG